ncbi:MAG: LptA/OstA family protein [bacterium]|nr:LptA/OstA family protein [bacterium]MDD5354447.1 LptA/OstA family protein [bacterium]
MANKVRGIIAFLIILSPFFLVEATVAEAEDTVDIKADYLEYQKQKDLVYGSGHAQVTSGDMYLEADEIFYNLKEETVTAVGHVVGKDKDQDLSGHEVTYNLKTKQGVLSYGKLYAYKWYITGPKMERQGPEKMYLPTGYMTTCDLEKPHFQIKASRIAVYPKKYLICHHARFYIGDLPVLYFPVYYQSLKKKKYTLNVYVGHNSTEGDFAKIVYGYPLTDNIYGKLYLDYMEYLGWGKGAQVEYNYPDRMNGSWYYYHIRQKERLEPPVLPEASRWNAVVSHWQRLDPTWIAQANVKVQSDQTFQKRYEEEAWRQVNNDITSFLALSKLEKTYTFRVLGERRDLWNETAQAYKPDYVYAPRVSFNTNQLRLPWSYSRKAPLYFTYNLETKRGYTQSQGYYLWDGNTNVTLINRLGLTRNMSLTPQIGLRELWQDRVDLLDTRNVLRTQYFTNLNLRTRVTDNLDWDLGHSYTEEFKARPNEVRGVISNLASTAFEFRFARKIKTAKTLPEVPGKYPWQIQASRLGPRKALPVRMTGPHLDILNQELSRYVPGYNVDLVLQKYSTADPLVVYSRKQLIRFRSSISYNLIHNGYFPVNRKERFTNLVNTLTLTPNDWITLSGTEEYNIIAHNTQRVSMDLRLAKNRWSAGLLTSYLKSVPGNLDIQSDVGFWLSESWKLNVHTKYQMSNDQLRITGTRITERSVQLFRDMHCWEMLLSWTKYQLEEEIWVRFNLKVFPERKVGFYHSQRVNGDVMEEEWNIKRQ